MDKETHVFMIVTLLKICTITIRLSLPFQTLPNWLFLDRKRMNASLTNPRICENVHLYTEEKNQFMHKLQNR